MIPALTQELLNELPRGPYVLIEDAPSHTMFITYLKDWGDGRGPMPQIGDALVTWKEMRMGPRGRPIWRGFAPRHVAIAHHLLSLLNHHHECTS